MIISPKHIVNTWSSANKVTLGQCTVNEKSNEITAIPELLNQLCISGCIVTIDAMGCQTKIATLIRGKGGYYLLALKGNQGTLEKDVDLYLQGELFGRKLKYEKTILKSAETVEKSRGRIETRKCWVPTEYESSKTFDLSANGFPNLPNHLGIGFINGIWNDAKGSRESAEYLSKLSGGYNIHAVFNATHGTCADLKECKKGLNYIATEPVKQLHKMWNSFFEKSSANSKFMMICHSQGAIHVRNALLDYPPELRERILVVAIAPAAYIYQETCAKVIHYRAEWWRDFVPRFDRAGARREKDSIVTISSHPKAAAFDHEFMSPTYQEKLQYHIKRYIKSQGNVL